MAVMERELRNVSKPAPEDVKAWVKEFWSATDKDVHGVPQARWQAVSMAIKLRVAGVGPRKAAELYKREPGSNAAQRYFTVARGHMEKLISHEEILKHGIGPCAALVLERQPQVRKRPRSRLVKAQAAYARLQRAIDAAGELFNARALIKEWLEGRKWPAEDKVKAA